MEQLQKRLNKHILATYFVLRWLVGLVALAFPLILWVGGLVSPQAAVRLQPSISAYYHTPLRDIFVGVLFVVGACLVVYRGFSNWENWILNIAGVLALGVALAPTGLPCDPGDEACRKLAAEVYSMPKVHVACAITFFVCIAIVCVFFSRRSLKILEKVDAKKARSYRRAYFLLGGLMVALPFATLGVWYWIERGLPPMQHHWTYATEFAAIWVFGIFWIVKGFEIRQGNADLTYLLEELESRSGSPETDRVRVAV